MTATSLSLSRRDPETSPHKDRGGDSAPHKHAVAARPSTRPAGAAAVPRRHTGSSSGQPAHLHVIPKGEQYPNQAASHPKNTRREANSNQGPGPAPPRRPLHIIERPRQQSRATKASPSRRGTHHNTLGPPLKNMSVERGKAGPPCEVHSTKRTPPRVLKPQPIAIQAPHQSANPRRRQTTTVPTTTTENATARAASTPSRGKRPPEPAPVPRTKRATAHATRFASLAQARRHRATCLEVADRFPTAKPLGDGRTEPFRTSRRARWCAARGPCRAT